MKKSIRFMFYFICISILLTQPCSAYLDPASTSYIIQIVVGIVIACGTALGIFWNKLTRLFKKKNKSEKPTADNKDGESIEAKTITADELLDDDE